MYDMQEIINKAHPILRQHLLLDNAFLIQLKAADVIDNEAHDRITRIIESRGVTMARDCLISIITWKPVDVYIKFMNIFKENDPYLYEKVKSIEDDYLKQKDKDASKKAASEKITKPTDSTHDSTGDKASELVADAIASTKVSQINQIFQRD